MKRSIKNAFAILLALVLILGIAACGATQNGTDSDKRGPDDLDRYLTIQDQSNDSFTKLMYKFAEDGKAKLLLYYPDYYAGAYINSDGYLVILTKHAREADIEYMKKICDNSNMLFIEAEYSYNELISIMDSVTNTAMDMQKSGTIDTFNVAIRDNENKIYVGLENENNETVKSAILSSSRKSTAFTGNDCVSFYHSGKLEPCGITLYPGSKIESGQTGSIGFKASYTANGTTKTGFITAGHITAGVSYVNETASIFSPKVGDVIAATISGSSDAAFVQTNSNYPLSNTVDGCTIQAGMIQIPAIGSTVYKIGAITGITSGTVSSNMFSGLFKAMNGKDLVWLKYMVQINNIYCEQGDSGGLLYTKSGGTAKVYGILSSKDKDSPYSYFSNAGILPWSISVIN